jgi:hypothetical protein
MSTRIGSAPRRKWTPTAGRSGSSKPGFKV